MASALPFWVITSTTVPLLRTYLHFCHVSAFPFHSHYEAQSAEVISGSAATEAILAPH